MKFSFLLMLFLAAILPGKAQNYFYVTGTVINAETNQPLQGASVFAQNSTLGTTSDAEGNFRLGLPQGGYDLIITFSGMEAESQRVSASEPHNNLVFKLKQKDNEMQEVAVVATTEVKDGYAKYGEFFMNEFIGQTTNSDQTIISNPDILKFYFSRKRNRLKIMAAEPLQIENKALGYKITYSLDSFTHEYDSHVSLYTGYPLFTEMETSDFTQMQKWQEARKEAYSGSLLHFMRALYGKDLKKEGFEIQFLINNKAQAVAVKNPYVSLQFQKDDSLNLAKFIPVQSNLGVIYTKEKPSASYTSTYPGEPKDFQFSLLTLKRGEPIMIEQNGYYYDQTDASISGYWEWQKVADMLPFNYSSEAAAITPPVVTQQAPIENNAVPPAIDNSQIVKAETTKVIPEEQQKPIENQKAAEPEIKNDRSNCMQEQQEKIINLVRKSISIDGMMYKNKMAEDYTIEVSAPATGNSVISVDFYRKSNAVHFPQIEQAIIKLKENLTVENFCNFDRIIIPVTIYFEDADKPSSAVNSRFENNANNKTYVLKPLGIKVYSRVD
jgi:hypothetical protein